MSIDLLSILFIATAIGFVVLFFVLPRWGPHYTSRLTCPNCKKTFNFHWIPGATIASLIQRNYRTLKCPYCHRKSVFDVAATRVRTARPSKAKVKA
jgi:DNA-directed RNA polymerase subunit RPC12/RpoP